MSTLRGARPELAVGRGITVDAHMRTSDPWIYAAGDAAEFEGESFGLWSVAAEQGETAALNALGGTRVYRGHVPVTALKVSGIRRAFGRRGTCQQGR